jgi:hypothetical protein
MAGVAGSATGFACVTTRRGYWGVAAGRDNEARGLRHRGCYRPVGQRLRVGRNNAQGRSAQESDEARARYDPAYPPCDGP